MSDNNFVRTFSKEIEISLPLVALWKKFTNLSLVTKSKSSKKKFDDDILLTELQNLGRTHRDRSRAAMYLAMADELKAGNLKLITLISQTRSLRRDLNPGHWANLWSHVIEYPFLIEKMKLSLKRDKLVDGTEPGKSYVKFDKEDWSIVIRLLLKDRYWRSEFKNLLLEKNTQTFVFQRYIAAHTVIKNYFTEKSKLSVVDCGSCLGVGPTAMMQNHFFSKISDQTPHQIINSSIQQGLPISVSYCLDLTDPFDRDNELWIKACSFYPQESPNYEIFSDQLTLLRLLLRSHILSGRDGDMTRIGKIWKNKKFGTVDAIIANTVMYQLSEEQRQDFYNGALEILKEKGIIVVTDFARKNEHDSSKLEFKEGGWFGGNKYRTFVLIKENGKLSEPLEVFRFPDARCEQVEVGIDYSRFFT